jgi:cellulose synthase/poly-beta-1,6-N-acetylglucosamine synthase-like glycosyltransferase
MLGIEVVHVVLIAMVLSGATVVVVGCVQFVLAGIHVLRRPYARVAEVYPRVAVVIPAWNEGAVLSRTIDSLFAMSYPREQVRVYIVDDASDDETPRIIAEHVLRRPGAVVNLRRERGGEGKAAVINHGLKRIQSDGWYEAVLIIDADVLLTPTALRRMARHLGDRQIGGVTAYIKEGTDPPNYVNRFIGFEYITAQAAARRAQNTLSAQACLAGGAQLIRREALEHLGGELDTSTLAEDTVTTFRIQLAGYDVRFEGNAVVWAEEPRTLAALWKQRVRWARGNTQVTWRFRRVWLHRMRVGALGGPTFAGIWASVVFMPVFMVLATSGLLALFFTDRTLSVEAFRALWLLTGCAFVFITGSSLLIDPEAGRRCWLQGLFFPGAVNLTLILVGLFGPIATALLGSQLDAIGLHGDGTLATCLLLFADLWLTASIFCAYLLKRLDDTGRFGWVVHPLLYVVGYGPLLCAITVGGYIAELRGAEKRWEKTEKVGRVGELSA